MDRRTERSDGSGGGTPTAVTSWATDDDLIDDEDTRPSGVMAPPRQPSRKPASAKSDAAKLDADKPASADAASPGDAASGGTAGGDVSANGGSARDTARLAAVDDTVVDGVPALPADTIGSSRGTWPKESGPDQETPEGAGGDSSAGPSGSWRSGSGLAGSSGPGSSGPASPARPSPAAPVSPASFAWEMPDPPSDSPSPPARSFLRSGLTVKGVASKLGSSAGAGQPAAGPGSGPARGSAQQAKSRPASSQKTPSQQAPSEKTPSDKAPSDKAQSKRTARQAHLTIARVEPWSVMKFSFVVSVVAFVILFVAVIVLYSVLSAVGVFDSLQRVVTSVTSSQTSTGVNAKAWFSASRVLGYTALLGSLNIVLITAMSTIGAVVYNLTSRLVGGVEVTLRETE